MLLISRKTVLRVAAAAFMLTVGGCSSGMNPMGLIGGSMFGAGAANNNAAAPAGGIGMAQQVGYAGGMMGGSGGRGGMGSAAGSIAGQVGGQMLVNHMQQNATPDQGTGTTRSDR